MKPSRRLHSLAVAVLLLVVVAGAPLPAGAIVPTDGALPRGAPEVTGGSPRPSAVHDAVDPVLALAAGIGAPRAGVWPLHPAPRVVSGFEPPLSEYGAGHRGVDLAGRRGQDVHAAAAGRISYAGLLAGIGVVVVDHGATRTTYQPVRATVALGTPVAAGEVLGTLGTLGSHCWPATCLHWGLIEGDTYLDPLTLVGGGPVRLLPLADGPGPVGPSP